MQVSGIFPTSLKSGKDLLFTKQVTYVILYNRSGIFIFEKTDKYAKKEGFDEKKEASHPESGCPHLSAYISIRNAIGIGCLADLLSGCACRRPHWRGV
jgi:hypothetical protein